MANRQIRQQVIDSVRTRGQANTADIAADLGRTTRELSSTMTTMTQGGMLRRVERGVYELPEHTGNGHVPADVVKQARRRLSKDERIANAIDALRPIVADSHTMVQLIHMMDEVAQ